MDSAIQRGAAPLELFADFYQETAQAKLAIREGRTALYLAEGRDPVALGGNDLAAMLSLRLKSRLQEQSKRVAAIGTQAEIDAYRTAQYAMAVLADELFIIELDWPGKDAWQDYLLERELFESNSGGCDFFLRLDELLGSRTHSALQEEVAAVFLMSLRLGFRGQHRGTHCEPQLKHYGDKLLRFIGAGRANAAHQPAFVQAYQHRIVGVKDERIAPLSRWYRLAAIGCALYLAISTAVWIAVTQRFSQALLIGS